MLDAHISACLEKNWSVFAMLIGLIRRLVNSPRFTRRLKQRANHLLRMAEAFARRLLVLRAHNLSIETRPIAEPGARAASRPASPRAKPPAGLCLAEPLPPFIPLSDEPFPQAEPALRPEVDPDEAADPAHAAQRLLTLEDILLRPAHHARRMARWLKRFTARTNRSTPFGIGRPPGSTRKPKDPDLDQRLRDTDFFARRALSTAPG